MKNLARFNECVDDNEFSRLEAIDPEQIDNEVLRKALERVRERTQIEPHSSHYTRHSSHSSHSKGAW
jgi:hypothetical protein